MGTGRLIGSATHPTHAAETYFPLVAFSTGANVVGGVDGSRVKNSPPQVPVGADVPRSRAALRRALVVHRRVSAGHLDPRNITCLTVQPLRIH
ncbi:MAG: hypothetical protein ABI947_14365 [Chloroflexota bacterium]